MRYLVPIGLLFVGLTIGYIIGVTSTSKSESNNSTTTDSIKTKLIHDTIVTKEIVTIPVVSTEELPSVDSTLIDTLISSEIILDTLTQTFLEKPTDTITDDGIKINTDKRIASTKVSIIYLNTNTDKDSLIKEALNINTVQNTRIIIEFWESPINYSGYKLSKSKLIVYGLSPQFEYEIYNKGEFYYLNFQSIFYQMIETNQFLPYVLVEEKDVMND